MPKFALGPDYTGTIITAFSMSMLPKCHFKLTLAWDTGPTQEP